VIVSVLIGAVMAALSFFLFVGLSWRWGCIRLVAFALILHGTFDVAHMHLIANGPSWRPPFYAAFDVTAAAILYAFRRNGYLWRP
jgi:hypothetical protein